MTGISTKLEVIKPEFLYAIGNIITQTTEWKPALDEISQLVHSFIIFDNLAVYLSDSKNNSVDVMYARALGRGRKAEADVSWGETLANQIIACNQSVLREPTLDPQQDRLQQAYMLGIPLTAQKICLGAIIFIRFGGPSFDTESQQLAEFIAGQITLLIQCQSLQLEYQKLEAQQAQSQLQEDFISTITHELRNPLGFIKGYTTTLLRSDTTWDQTTQQEFLEIIDQETDRLEELIENLLNSARLQSGQLKMQFQPVIADSLINTVITRSRLHYPDLTILIETDKNVPPIFGDAGRLAQVLENLISNAVKYAPGSDLAITVRKEKEYACISVKDHGPGIPEQYLQHLFERFYRIPNQTPNVHGSGLGLYICKQIVDAHRGFISANSIEGKGTSFDIRLPYKA